MVRVFSASGSPLRVRVSENVRASVEKFATDRKACDL
jgi:hypothetical protein